jgi:DNA gyrase subunit B
MAVSRISSKNKKKIEASNRYDASKIVVLEGLEAVRKRPAMYIGNTDEMGLHQILYEIIDNAIDEALAGYCDKISVVLNKDGSVTVSDNGRGIPVDIHKQTGKSALETVMCTLHAGGKFSKEVYKVSGGLHGIGMSCTNALSEWMETRVMKDGKIYRQKYKRGIPVTPVEVIGKSKDTGTIQTFKPDPTIFSVTEYNAKTILTKLRQQAYLTPKVEFSFRDNRKSPSYEYKLFFEGGIKAYVQYLTLEDDSISSIFYMKGEQDGVLVEVALRYIDDVDTEVLAFTNNIFNSEGGTHLIGFKTALTKCINDYGTKQELLRKEDRLTGEDVQEGLVAVVSVKVPNPQFEGQTKIKLNNPEVAGIVKGLVSRFLKQWLEEHPQEGKGIVEKCILSAKARRAAKAARLAVIRKGAFEGGSLPGKLADCSSRDPEISELFIVEGISAGGSTKQGRDRATQAVLPLLGKPINTEKHRIDKVLANEKLRDLIVALGCGIGDQFDIKKLRYHKIIIMTDADVDGSHIATLLLTFFYRKLRPIIENGYLYLALPPLYRIEVSSNEIYWAQNDEEKEKIVEKLKKEKKKIKTIQRYKGLGEMDANQLWETTMNPKVRVLKRITIEDAEEADKVFNMLMGTQVVPRKRFIQSYAKYAELDI